MSRSDTSKTNTETESSTEGEGSFSTSGKLQVTTPADQEILMRRVFNAPRHLVFEAMTTPELVKRWLTGPPGWSLETCEVDLRVGGSFRYVWHGPDGVKMGMSGVYLELNPPERVVATEKFDEAWYEGEAVGTMVLTEQLGWTTLSQTVRYQSNAVRDAVLRTPMEQGVGYGYDQLEKLLDSMKA